MNNECSCWMDYIRRCVVSKTFHVATKVSGTKTVQESLQCHQTAIFPTSDMKDDTGNFKDSNLKSYQQAIQKMPKNKDCKLKIAEEQSDSRWNNVKIDGRVDQSLDDDNDIGDIEHYTKSKSGHL